MPISDDSEPDSDLEHISIPPITPEIIEGDSSSPPNITNHRGDKPSTVNIPTEAPSTKALLSTTLIQAARLWHVRLGHIGLDLLKKIALTTKGLPNF